jgi:hypothetical protein
VRGFILAGEQKTETTIITDFERCRRTIGRREVTITSWVDNRKQTWMASAPAYTHLLAGFSDDFHESASRVQAIERVVKALTERLASRVAT